MQKQASKSWSHELLNRFEVYIGTGIFLFLTVILTVQVVGRYIFQFSFAWIEEVSVICLVVMIYCGVAGAVTGRQFLKIDMLLNLVSFRVKRVLLILNTVIQAVFTGWLTYYLVRIIETMGKVNSVYSITRIPKVYIYILIAFFLILSILRAGQEIVKLTREQEHELGKAIPAFDLEKIWQEGVAAREAYLAQHGQAPKPEEGGEAQ